MIFVPMHGAFHPGLADDAEAAGLFEHMFAGGPGFHGQPHVHIHHHHHHHFHPHAATGLGLAEMIALMAQSAAAAGARAQADEEPDKRTPQNIVDRLPCRTSAGGAGEKECAVCLCEFERGDRVRMLPCRHEFHAGCIDRWLLEQNRTCPCCRVDVCTTPAPLNIPADLDALSVRELKDILASRDVDFRDCCEKSHLVERVKSLAA